MKKVLNDIFTGRDNQTVDILRVTFALVECVFILLVIIKVIFTHDFDMIQFATAEGLIMSGLGAGAFLKQNTEPQYGEMDKTVNKSIKKPKSTRRS